MNFLTLCKRLVQESPITGNGPATVVDQTGEMARVVDWINTAYLDILSLHPVWRFMTEDFTFNATIGKATYTATEAGITDLETWKVHDLAMRVYEGAVSDERFLVFEPWEKFRPYYNYGSLRTQTNKPIVVTIRPNNSIMFWAIPNKEYTIDGEYYKTPVELIGDTDTPVFPAAFHMAIVWSALMMYCAYESIPDLYAQAESKYRKIVRKLENEQLPLLRHGRPLA